MTNSKEHSLEIARALDKTALRATELQPKAVIAAFDEVQAKMLPKVASSAKLVLETKRRVAEWKFRLLSERDLPFPTVARLRTRLRALGYTNLELEATMEIFFAQYCIRKSRFKEARTAMRTLMSKLQRAMKTRRLPIYRQLSEDVLRTLSNIPA